MSLKKRKGLKISYLKTIYCEFFDLKKKKKIIYLIKLEEKYFIFQHSRVGVRKFPFALIILY